MGYEPIKNATTSKITVVAGILLLLVGCAYGEVVDSFFRPQRNVFYLNGTDETQSFSSGEAIGQTFIATETFDFVDVFYAGGNSNVYTISLYGPLSGSDTTVSQFRACGLVGQYKPAVWVSGIELTLFFESQPPGRYYIELSDGDNSKVTARRNSTYANGQTYINGTADSTLDLKGSYGQAMGFFETTLIPETKIWGPTGKRGSLQETVSFVPTDSVSDSYEINRQGVLAARDSERYLGLTPGTATQPQVGVTWMIPLGGSCEILSIIDRHRVFDPDANITCMVSADGNDWTTLYQDNEQGSLKIRTYTTEALAGSSTLYLSYTITSQSGNLSVESATVSEISITRYNDTGTSDDITLWTVHPMARLYKQPSLYYQYVFDANAVQLYSAKKEWETFQLIVSAAPYHDLSNLNVEISSLEHASGGGTIAANNIRWYRIADSVHREGTVPDVLDGPESFTTINSIEERNYPLFVEIYVPRDVNSGDYTGAIQLKSGATVLASKEINLKVWDFTLPSRTNCRMGLFDHAGSTIDGGDYWYSLGIGDANYHNDLDNLYIEHRIAPGLPEHTQLDNAFGISSSFGYGKDVNLVIHPNSLRFARDRYHFWAKKGLGFNFIGGWAWYALYHWQDTGDTNDLVGLENYYRTYGQLLTDGNWLDYCYTRHADEASLVFEKAQEFADYIHQWAPGLKIMITPHPYIGYQAMLGYADIWTNYPEKYAGQRSFYQGRVAAGEEVWLYIHYRIFHMADPVSLRQFFWTLADENLQGSVLWATALATATDKQGYWWDNRQNSGGIGNWPGDGLLWYTDSDTQRWRASVRVKNVRDGIEDFECWKMLKDFVADANNSSYPIYSDAVTMRNTLHSWDIRTNISPGIFDVRENPSVIVNGRISLGNLLEQLPNNYKLNVEIHGSGQVNVVPQQDYYTHGQVVTLTPDAQGSLFKGWGLDATGLDEPLQIVMDADKNVLAFFSYGLCGIDGILKADVNQDCEINLIDIALIAEYWQKCNDPTNEICLW